MEETTDDTRLAEGPVHNAQWWQSGLIDKLRKISLASPDETSSSKSKGQLDCGSPAFHLASQTLWDTGKLAEPIPDGFYFVYPERRFTELFYSIPSIDELQALDADGLRPNVILVDARKDKKLSMLKQLAIKLVRGLNPNPAATIKKLAGLVCDFFKRPKLEPGHVRGALEEVSHALDNQGIHMLGHVKYGSCHSKAILFKVLADTVGLECMLMMGLHREGVIQRSDAYRDMSAIVVLNSVEFLVDLARNPGKLVPCSAKAVLLSHLSAGESDSAEYDSYDSPIEPNSPVRGFSDQTEVEGLSHSDPNVANSFWQSRKKAIAEQRTTSSSPEHPLFRGHGRSLLGDRRHSFRVYDNDINASRSVGASPIESRRRRRRCISMVPEIGDDIVRAVREMSETLKRNRHPEEQVSSSYSCSASEQEDCSEPRGSVSRFNPDAHDGLYGQKPLACKLPLNLKQLHSHKAVSMPSSPQRFSRKASLMSDTPENFANPDMMSTFSKVLESSKFLNQPLLPFEEWNIDFSEITIGARVGIGFFGEVFRGTWNGLEVAIKVFLEQDPTAENIEDFCNEISILSRIRHPNVILFLGACTTPPRLSLVTEFMEMSSLYYLIHASALKKKLSWQRRLKMLVDICRGLTSIHRMNVVHRDLKSANCLVNKHWVVKICDFGLSRKLITRPMKDSSSAGTPEWMAPELIRNEPFTEKCDIFSLGVIMWELCTLKRPWEGIPSVQVVYAVGHDRQTLEIPEGPLGKLIADCWAEPDERPSCQEILSRLQECELLLC
ncbi:probable serine/threonine-protein kinase SIS8 [Salvia hispanica]|uniref:probable serine/threonine-protein kinase SIS8 n=1 Tax=Salvia hispanica TaxID=49212 RepID=UPI0020096CFD|nr:probable serine/threonine-protein kinase SIS8 [Salvia hispanica]XP_047947839.1 probable serine/threonine-protein kinase SIS8 [Salvia hispanica]XP_047947840.1 probable serine/threonine-protein kinase SIS8 [Salvia hispanica]